MITMTSKIIPKQCGIYVIRPEKHVECKEITKEEYIKLCPRYRNIQTWQKNNPGYQNGELNPSWKGGTSRSNLYRRTKEAVIFHKIDPYVCQYCGVRSVNGWHNIHHIDGDKTNNTKENLRVLCVEHHNSGSKSAAHQRKRVCGRFASNDQQVRIEGEWI